mgnify:CR=1 FL=1
MPNAMYNLIGQYIEEIKKIYGSHVRQIILYGSYARGDFRPCLLYTSPSPRDTR